MSAVSQQAGKLWTEAEIQALPDNGCLHEVIAGQLVMSPKNTFQHEQICERWNYWLNL